MLSFYNVDVSAFENDFVKEISENGFMVLKCEFQSYCVFEPKTNFNFPSRESPKNLKFDRNLELDFCLKVRNFSTYRYRKQKSEYIKHDYKEMYDFTQLFGPGKNCISHALLLPLEHTHL